MGATASEIEAAFFVAIDLGIISPNNSNKNVTVHVAIQIAADSETQKPPELAILIAILVANAAVKVFTRLFQIRIVISKRSLFSLIFLRAAQPNRDCFNRDSSL